MAKYKPRNRAQTVLVPVVLKDQLQPGTLEHTIDYLIDNRIDLSIFDKRYKNDDAGRPAWNPAVLLKIVLFAYSRGIFSSRTIARACRENITFMALSDDSRPHFTTIADFISTMEQEITDVFQKVLLICSELDLIGGEKFAIDGCKLSSNASKEWSGTHEQLRRKINKIKCTTRDLIKKHRSKDKDEDDDSNTTGRINKLQRKVEKIEQFLSENEEKIGKRGRKLQSNITDNESAKMQSSHGMVQGYNGLTLVDSKHQIIMHAEAFGSGPEQELLEPMINGAKENMKADGNPETCFNKTIILGDTGYHTEDNCKLMEDEMIDAYFPDVNYRKRDPRFANAQSHKPPPKKKRFTVENFIYEKKKDRYVCPEKHYLMRQKRNRQIRNLTGRHYMASTKSCKRCGQRKECLNSEKTKQRTLFITERKYDRNYSEAMMKKIDTPRGRNLYSHRMGIVEPVFSNIRFIKRLDRFTLRGKTKVTIQWMLYSIVHNIEKICNYGFAYG